MTDFIAGMEGAIPAPDTTAAEACPFTPLPDPNDGHVRRAIAEEAAQQLFDKADPYDASFHAERRLRDQYDMMLERTPVRGNYLIDRTLRRSFFTARSHYSDIHLMEMINTSIAEGNSLVDKNWSDDPDFYRSTTVFPYAGSADRFMRTIVGMGDLAAARAQPHIEERFIDAFHTAYRRFFTSHEAYKKAYPDKDVPETSPDPEINWYLGRRGKADNVVAMQIAHALAYYRQHPDATVDDLWRSSLTSSTVLSTPAHIRRHMFARLRLKQLPRDFDAWETEGTQDFLRHRSLFVYDDSGLAWSAHKSLAAGNDSNCSGTLRVGHKDSYDLAQINTIFNWVREHSNWPGVDDGQGGLLHEKGTFEETHLAMILGSIVGRTTIFPAFIRAMQNRS